MNRLLNNWTLKLTSLVLAVALWGHVRGEVNPLETATFTIQVDRSAPRGWTFQKAESLPANARVTIRAPRNSLRELKGGSPLNPLAPADTAPSLQPKLLSAHLEVAVLKAGEATATLKTDSQIEDAEIIGIKPADVLVTLAQD